MSVHIDHIQRFPIKGLGPQVLKSATLKKGEGLPNDRRSALAHGKSKFNPTRPVGVSKNNFLMLARNAKLARLETIYDSTATHVTITLNGDILCTANLNATDDVRALETIILGYLGREAYGSVNLVTAPRQILSDVCQPMISLISLATVRLLSQNWGEQLDPLRFRGNLMFEGAEPWAEFNWVDRDLQIGDAILRVVKRTKRCAATMVNPLTAERDINVPRRLNRSFGHIDCGVYATVRRGGNVMQGSKIILI